MIAGTGCVPGISALIEGSTDMKILAALAVSLSAGGAMAAPATEAPSAFGKVMVGETGMTLYTFSKDMPGVSTCDDACTEHWPPLFADETDKADGRFTVIERADETYQWAADGKPLYFYWEDTVAGDTLGEGRHGTWSVARP
jgi:predicted lipoprotein with Yx(FWY)xxD motif